MDPAELEIIMSENMKSQHADKLDFPDVDSDGDVRPALGASSSDEAETQSEDKFVKRAKRRILRRRIRMERRRGQTQINLKGRSGCLASWSFEEMDRWITTTEDDPEFGSSEDSLIDFA